MAQITIVGLGPGSLDLMTCAALRALEDAAHVYLRTAVHPVVGQLKARGIHFSSFDHYYEASTNFEEVYDRIIQTLITKVEEGQEVTYAVPGHPLVAEATVLGLLAWCREHKISARVIPSMSCLDAIYATLGIDPTDNLLIADGLEIKKLDLDKPRSLLITQVYNRFIASEVKLYLMEKFGDEYPVVVVRGAGIPREEKVATLPLHELDTLPWLDHLTSVYVGVTTGTISSSSSGLPLEEGSHWSYEGSGVSYPLDPLVKIMVRLRSPGGCPWDREQDHVSLRRYLLEETYELLEAIDENRWDKVQEELGDVLLQVVFHAQIAAEFGRFDINDVIATVSEKLIRRHPHVFGNVEAKDAETVTRNWESIKSREQTGKERTSLLDGVPAGLPALMQAEKIQKKAARVGFEWENVAGALEKVKEEIEELIQAYQKAEPGANGSQEELGDVLFSLVNVARYLNVDPEMALRSTTRKFIERFHYIEEKAREEGRSVQEMTLEEMNALWEAAKSAPAHPAIGPDPCLCREAAQCPGGRGHRYPEDPGHKHRYR